MTPCMELAIWLWFINIYIYIYIYIERERAIIATLQFYAASIAGAGTFPYAFNKYRFTQSSVTDGFICRP